MNENQNSKSYYNMAWISFVFSFIGMAAGLLYLEADPAIKGFFAMAYLFSVSSCFTLAKVIRDRHEEDLLRAKMEHANADRFMRDKAMIKPE